MEVRPGYSQTEVGVIPNDWGVKSIRELAQIKTGPFGTVLKASEYAGTEGVPLISVGEVGRGFFKVTPLTPLVPATVVRRLPQYVLRTGDIVFGRKGAVERSALVTEREDGWFLGSDGIGVRPRPECFPPYLACQFQRNAVQTWLLQNATGTTMPSLNQAILGNVHIPYAPLPEQKAIAVALSDIDALLSGLGRLIAKKRDLKQAAMQQLLTGQTRLPGFWGEWEVKRLDEVADIRSGGTPSTNDPASWDGDIAWCTPTDITLLAGRKYLSSTARRITAHGLKQSSAEVIPAGSVVMTSRATIGECAINAIPMTTNQGFKNFVPFEHVDAEFLYYILSTQKAKFISLCGGSTFLEIGKTQLRGYTIRLPSEKSEQTAIAAVLSDMDAELTALEARRDKTRALKQGMMQELLTGRTRLVDATPAVPVKEQAPAQERKANIHFLRAVLAAEIVDQLHREPTFGHVKFEKMMFLAEHLCQVDTGSTYLRKAAGPLDRKALHSIDSQLRNQHWFDARKHEGRYTYVPLAKRGGHRAYFDRYYAPIADKLAGIIETFRALDTERCEIVATLYAAWNDLLRDKGAASDDAIVHEVLNHWHEAKQRIAEDRWRNALGWMRDKGFVPQGVVLP